MGINKKSKHLTELAEKNIVEKYLKKTTIHSICKEYEIGQGKFYNILKKYNIERRSISNSELSDEKELEIVKGYESGMDFKTMCKYFKVGVIKINKILEKHGVKKRTRYEQLQFKTKLEKKKEAGNKAINNAPFICITCKNLEHNKEGELNYRCLEGEDFKNKTECKKRVAL